MTDQTGIESTVVLSPIVTLERSCDEVMLQQTQVESIPDFSSQNIDRRRDALLAQAASMDRAFDAQALIPRWRPVIRYRAKRRCNQAFNVYIRTF